MHQKKLMFKRLYMMNWLKNLMLLIQANEISKKGKSVDKKYIIREVKENEFYCKSSRSIKYP